jgi:PAS domain S-box-containing protein
VALDGSVLIVDGDVSSRQALAGALTQAGFACVSIASLTEAETWLARAMPSAVLVDLDLPTGAEPAHGWVRAFKGQPRLANVPVLVLTELGSDDEVNGVFASGADDFIKKPFHPAEVTARLKSQLRLRDYMVRHDRRERDSRRVLELTQVLALALDPRDILYTVTRKLAELTQADRCSLVLVARFVGRAERGAVIASSDDARVRDLPLDLEHYPEIRQVLATGKPLSIPNASEHPLLEVVRRGGHEFAFSTLALVPILQEHRPLGVIFLRARAPITFSDYELDLVHTVANATAIALRNARILEDLREEQRESTSLRVEAERRLQRFRRYADFFESSADGMIVIDRHGRILFSNPRAREILGFDMAELAGMPFGELLAPEERDRASRLLRGFAEGVYPRGLDVTVRIRSGEKLILSVSSSSVLHDEQAVLFSFRDVTRERRTAAELRRTKEFLERLIESSVDGIISADLEGTVRVFNRAACRIFGYAPEEVIGKLNVEQLYPPGGAREMMLKIRDPSVSGPGRIENQRVLLRGRGGEAIAVSLSASLILDGESAVGSVGIVTDLRERLRMEARLERAHDELRAREKQAIVAELAGGAAHELNQPLTSVLNYAELLVRSVDPHSPLERAARVIISESERMAEIVRRIGKITKYETKSYVGEQKILDLDRASDAGDEAAPEPASAPDPTPQAWAERVELESNQGEPAPLTQSSEKASRLGESLLAPFSRPLPSLRLPRDDSGNRQSPSGTDDTWDGAAADDENPTKLS